MERSEMERSTTTALCKINWLSFVASCHSKFLRMWMGFRNEMELFTWQNLQFKFALLNGIIINNSRCSLAFIHGTCRHKKWNLIALALVDACARRSLGKICVGLYRGSDIQRLCLHISQTITSVNWEIKQMRCAETPCMNTRASSIAR